MKTRVITVGWGMAEQDGPAPGREPRFLGVPSH